MSEFEYFDKLLCSFDIWRDKTTLFDGNRALTSVIGHDFISIKQDY